MSDTEAEPFLTQKSREERLAQAKLDRARQHRQWTEYDIVTPVPQNRKKTIRIVKTLFEAVASNDLPEVERLLRNKADPNATYGRGFPPLHRCIINNNEQIVRLLLHYDADVNATDVELSTPLHVAAKLGYIDIAQLLISNGANLLAMDDNGNMPYDLCDDRSMIQNVIESEMAAQGVTQEIIDAERAKPEQKMLADMKLLHQQGQPLDARQPDGSTYLHAAAARGYFDVVAFLLRVGIQPSMKDSDSWMPVHAAAYWDHPDIVEMLCDYGADINAKNSWGETPMDLAYHPETKTVIQTIIANSEAQKKKRVAFGVRDSRRQSRKKNKFASPGPLTTPADAENPFGSRGAIRRSLRESSGISLAKLEAQQERSKLYTDDENSAFSKKSDPSKKRSTDKKPASSSSVNEWLRQLDTSTAETEGDCSAILSDTSAENGIDANGKPKKGKGRKFLCCVIS